MGETCMLVLIYFVMLYELKWGLAYRNLNRELETSEILKKE